jgi:Tol biopolymer transport system component
LVAHAGDAFWPQLSRDGRRLLFARGGDVRSSVWVSHSNGTVPRRLVRRVFLPDASWAPNDREVLVLAAGRNRSRAFTVSRLHRRRRRPHAIDSGPIAWSPDGGLLAWVHGGPHGERIEAISPTGHGRRALVRFVSGIRVRELAWSPDGRRLVFTASKHAGDD